MKLYIYEHCPFCVKARMIFGLKSVPITLNVLLNDDEETPIGLVGKKMVPILIKEEGSPMAESMDIVEYIDRNYGEPLVTGATNPAIGKWLKEGHPSAYQLLLPRIARASFEEFATPGARAYFIKKKEAANGSLDELLLHSEGLIKKVSQRLRDLEPLIQQSNACNGELSVDDFALFAELRSLSIVAGLDWPTKVADYRDNMAKQSQINLLSALAS